MSDKLLVIVSSGEKEKALTGLTFALRTLSEGWMEQVKVVIFGPAEKVLAADTDLQQAAHQIAQVEKPVACRFIAERDGIAEKLTAAGLTVDYVGKMVNDLIKDGFTPLVF